MHRRTARQKTPLHSGVSTLMPDEKSTEKSVSTGGHCTNYKAELEAIKKAQKLMGEVTADKPGANAVILSDSKSVKNPRQPNRTTLEMPFKN
ncbi:hypothetical protein ElyMa_004326900 [Elysia marginata]|uniref:RNase H type-1 domain-containing protein n=1 Tax=Elysia marginata TaxID=1093978 RepID=A0AAV4H212_9GAST|nr:hypothetical protein ElyMa_004326900 [Elysia marginata]